MDVHIQFRAYHLPKTLDLEGVLEICKVLVVLK